MLKLHHARFLKQITKCFINQNHIGIEHALDGRTTPNLNVHVFTVMFLWLGDTSDTSIKYSYISLPPRSHQRPQTHYILLGKLPQPVR